MSNINITVLYKRFVSVYSRAVQLSLFSLIKEVFSPIGRVWIY